MEFLILLGILIMISIQYFQFNKLKMYEESLKMVHMNYVDGYIRGFKDCGKKDFKLLESLPEELKDKYQIKIQHDKK